MPGTRSFFLLCLVFSTGLTAYLTGSALSVPSESGKYPQAVDGLRVWKQQGCEHCHTLYGQGGAFAPDLTRILEQRGSAYIREFMVNPQAFHPGERIMPRFTITRDETDALIALLDRTASTDSPVIRFP